MYQRRLQCYRPTTRGLGDMKIQITKVHGIAALQQGIRKLHGDDMTREAQLMTIGQPKAVEVITQTANT